MSQFKKDIDVIYNRYYRDIYFFCYRMCESNESLAEELTQNAFFKAFQSADSFRGNCSVKTWLCQIARNDYISYLRKNKHLSTTAADELLHNIAAPQESAQTRLEDSESAAAIRRILDTLKPPYGDVFRQKVLQDMSYQEIALSYNKTANWARVIYYRAKQQIIETMQQADFFAQGEICLLYCEEGEINFYLGENGIRNLGLVRSYNTTPRYQQLIASEIMPEVNTINYCKPDGTVITTLWQTGDPLPKLIEQ